MTIMQEYLAALAVGDLVYTHAWGNSRHGKPVGRIIARVNPKTLLMEDGVRVDKRTGKIIGADGCVILRADFDRITKSWADLEKRMRDKAALHLLRLFASEINVSLTGRAAAEAVRKAVDDAEVVLRERGQWDTPA